MNYCVRNVPQEMLFYSALMFLNFFCTIIYIHQGKNNKYIFKTLYDVFEKFGKYKVWNTWSI